MIASSPWCTVTVDGQARGTTPLNVKLKAGPHEVVLANPEYKIKRTLAVEIEANQTVRKSLDFAPGIANSYRFTLDAGRPGKQP